MRINNYSKMRRSNVKAREYLIDNLYTDIHFFPHTRFIKGYVLAKQEFDGICFDSNNRKMTLFQIKSNKNIPKETEIDYLRIAKYYNIKCLWINVRDREKILIKSYSFTT